MRNSQQAQMRNLDEYALAQLNATGQVVLIGGEYNAMLGGAPGSN
jgi:hypothetical protein